MAKTVESIPSALGDLRDGLVKRGFTHDQAFWLIQDLIRKGETPQWSPRLALTDD